MHLQNLRQYASRSVPRYTSYPTAPHFSDRIGADDYAGWLGKLDPAAPVSLYLHLPFCRQLCWYCGCNMKLAKRNRPITEYIGTLLQELDLLAQHLPGRMGLSHLHWGGGTPTAQTPDDLARVMDTIRDRFDITDDAELAIESDPRTLTPDMIAMIGDLGFNRASFGVQEFDPKVQAAINRVQPPEMVLASVDGLRAAGVNAINFDLIYGLPHQTVGTLLNTIHLCADMRPNRIALFGYAHVPWMAKKQRLIDEAALPGASERIAQAQASSEALVAAGYIPIGLDHFALPDDPLATAAQDGTLRRNFQGYTTDYATALLGLGATSIGRTPSGYVQNIAETGAWTRAVQAGVLPIGKGVALSDDDQLRGYVIEQLMCFGHVDLDAAGAQHHAAPDWYVPHLDELDEMARDGLLLRTGGRIVLDSLSGTLVRVVSAVFDAYRVEQAARHAVAV